MTHDGCEGCRYTDKDIHEHPWNVCKCAYIDQWEITKPPTRYEKIMQDMTVEKMAELMTRNTNMPRYDNIGYLYDDHDGALQAEIAWLNEVSE